MEPRIPKKAARPKFFTKELEKRHGISHALKEEVSKLSPRFRLPQGNGSIFARRVTPTNEARPGECYGFGCLSCHANLVRLTCVALMYSM